LTNDSNDNNEYHEEEYNNKDKDEVHREMGNNGHLLGEQ
jgi:hypothetical protein